MMSENLVYYLNGEYVPKARAVVPVEERGYNFADGLYEVCRVYGGKPLTLERHIQRLINSARAIRLELGLTLQDFREIIDRLVEVNGSEEGYAWIQVTRGIAPRGHTLQGKLRPTVAMTVKRQEAVPLQKRYRGIKGITVPDLRHGYCDIKTISLLPNVMARLAADDAGVQEAIFVGGRFVKEGAASNVYIVEDGAIRTHPLGNILPGITRSIVLELADELGVPVVERPFTVQELYEAEEFFLSASIREILPIVEVDGRSIAGGSMGPITQQIIDGYIRYVEKACGQYWPSAATPS